MIAMVTTEVNRMGHMPQLPLWNAVEIAVSMERPLRWPDRFGLQNGDAGLDARRVQSQIHNVSGRDGLCCTSRTRAFRRSISGRLGAKRYDAIEGTSSRLVVSEKICNCSG